MFCAQATQPDRPLPIFYMVALQILMSGVQTRCRRIAVLTNVSAGTYTVTVSNGGNQCATASVTIQGPQPLAVNLSADTSTCFAQGKGSLNVDVTGGVEPYAFRWNPNTDSTYLLPGSYNLTVTDSNNCPASASVTIDSASPITITGNIKPAACPDNNGSINVSVNGGTPGYRLFMEYLAR